MSCLTFKGSRGRRHTHIFLLQVEDMVDGVVHILGQASHSHSVWVFGTGLREPDIHLKGNPRPQDKPGKLLKNLSHKNGQFKPITHILKVGPKKSHSS